VTAVASPADHTQPNRCGSGPEDTDARGPSAAEIDDAAPAEGPPISYPHGHRQAVSQIRDLHQRSEGQGPVGCSEPVHVEDLARGGPLSVEGPSVPGGEPGERVASGAWSSERPAAVDRKAWPGEPWCMTGRCASDSRLSRREPSPRGHVVSTSPCLAIAGSGAPGPLNRRAAAAEHEGCQDHRPTGHLAMSPRSTGAARKAHAPSIDAPARAGKNSTGKGRRVPPLSGTLVAAATPGQGDARSRRRQVKETPAWTRVDSRYAPPSVA